MDRWPVGGLVTTVRRLKRWDIYLVALLYVAVTIAMTYPVAFCLSSELAGFDHQDSFEHLWMLWWGKKAIVDLHTSPANSSFIYYPLKIHHPMLAVEPYTKLVTIPLVMALGPLVAYNLHFLASFVLTASSKSIPLCKIGLPLSVPFQGVRLIPVEAGETDYWRGLYGIRGIRHKG